MRQRIKQLSGRFVQTAPGYLKQLRDVRMVGLLVFVIVALMVTWSGVGIIQTNYELQQRIARLEQENEIQRLRNQNTRLRNQYFETDQYLELQARRQFGRAAPGETLVLVPESVALANSRDIPPRQEPTADRPKADKPAYQKNFEAWMEFLFRRGNGSD